MYTYPLIDAVDILQVDPEILDEIDTVLYNYCLKKHITKFMNIYFTNLISSEFINNNIICNLYMKYKKYISIPAIITMLKRFEFPEDFLIKNFLECIEYVCQYQKINIDKFEMINNNKNIISKEKFFHSISTNKKIKLNIDYYFKNKDIILKSNFLITNPEIFLPESFLRMYFTKLGTCRVFVTQKLSFRFVWLMRRKVCVNCLLSNNNISKRFKRRFCLMLDKENNNQAAYQMYLNHERQNQNIFSYYTTTYYPNTYYPTMYTTNTFYY